MCVCVCASSVQWCLLGNVLCVCVDVSYHGKRHAVNLMFVFGLVLSERAVPKQRGGGVRDYWEKRTGGEIDEVSWGKLGVSREE